MSDELTRIEPLPVDVAIEEPTITDEQMQEVLRRQGFAEVALARLKDVRAMGVYLRGQGVVKMQMGRALINQQRMDDAMRQMSDLLTKMVGEGKVSNAIRLGKTLGYMCGRLTDAQKFMAGMASTRGGRPLGGQVLSEPLNKGFVPGQDVTPGVTLIQREVHIRPEMITHHEINGKNDK